MTLDRQKKAIRRKALVGAAQIKAGMAWYNDKYARELSSQQRQNYVAAQAQARAAGLGLWVYQQPVAPWKWLRARR